MNYCTDAQLPAISTFSTKIRQKVATLTRFAAPLVLAPNQANKNAYEVLQLIDLHRSVTQAFEHAMRHTELFVRLKSYTKSVLLAAELVEMAKLVPLNLVTEITAAAAKTSSLRNPTGLASADQNHHASKLWKTNPEVAVFCGTEVNHLYFMHTMVRKVPDSATAV